MSPPSCFFNFNPFFLPMMYQFFFFLFQLIFNQFFNIIIRKIIPVVFLIDIDEDVVPLDEWTESSFAFYYGKIFIPIYWCIGLLFLFDQFDSFFQFHTHRISTSGKRYIHLSKFYIGTKTAIVHFYGLSFIYT